MAYVQSGDMMFMKFFLEAGYDETCILREIWLTTSPSSTAYTPPTKLFSNDTSKLVPVNVIKVGPNNSFDLTRSNLRVGDIIFLSLGLEYIPNSSKLYGSGTPIFSNGYLFSDGYFQSYGQYDDKFERYQWRIHGGPDTPPGNVLIGPGENIYLESVSDPGVFMYCYENTGGTGAWSVQLKANQGSVKSPLQFVPAKPLVFNTSNGSAICGSCPQCQTLNPTIMFGTKTKCDGSGDCTLLGTTLTEANGVYTGPCFNQDPTYNFLYNIYSEPGNCCDGVMLSASSNRRMFGTQSKHASSQSIIFFILFLIIALGIFLKIRATN